MNQANNPIEAQEAQVELAQWHLSILAACVMGEQTGKQLMEAAGYVKRLRRKEEQQKQSAKFQRLSEKFCCSWNEITFHQNFAQ